MPSQHTFEEDSLLAEFFSFIQAEAPTEFCSTTDREIVECPSASLEQIQLHYRFSSVSRLYPFCNGVIIEFSTLIIKVEVVSWVF